MSSKKQKNGLTLDAEHKKMVSHFEKAKCKLPELRKKLEKLEKEYSVITKKLDYQCTEDEIFRKSTLRQEIDQTNMEIDNIVDDKKEIDYYLKVSPILMEYYDSSTQKENEEYLTDEEDNEEKVDFKIKTRKYSKITDYVEVNDDFNKANLLNDYCMLVNNEYSKEQVNSYHNSKVKCKECGIDKVVYVSEGILACKECGDAEYLIIDSEDPNYADMSKDNSNLSYKRINHLNELLTQFQAKESTEIPQEVYDKIIVEIKKMRIKNLKSPCLFTVAFLAE